MANTNPEASQGEEPKDFEKPILREKGGADLDFGKQAKSEGVTKLGWVKEFNQRANCKNLQKLLNRGSRSLGEVGQQQKTPEKVRPILQSAQSP